MVEGAVSYGFGPFDHSHRKCDAPDLDRCPLGQMHSDVVGGGSLPLPSFFECCTHPNSFVWIELKGSGEVLVEAAANEPTVDEKVARLFAIDPRHAIRILPPRAEDAAEEFWDDIHGEAGEAVPEKPALGDDWLCRVAVENIELFPGFYLVQHIAFSVGVLLLLLAVNCLRLSSCLLFPPLLPHHKICGLFFLGQGWYAIIWW
jgi:hypothetical protein